MASVAFLETLAVVSMTLGAVVGAVVLALPSLLRRALESIDKTLIAERLKRRQKAPQAKGGPLRRLRRLLIVTREDYLESERKGLLTSVRDGFFSALSFSICGLVSLFLLTVPYAIIDGVPYVLLSTLGQAMLATPFLAGAFFLVLLGTSFYTAVQLSLGLPIGDAD